MNSILVTVMVDYLGMLNCTMECVSVLSQVPLTSPSWERPRKTSSFHHSWSDADWKTTWWKLEEQLTKSLYILGLFCRPWMTGADVVVLLHSGVYVSNSIPVSGTVTVSVCVRVCDCEDHWFALSRPTVSVCALADSCSTMLKMDTLVTRKQGRHPFGMVSWLARCMDISLMPPQLLVSQPAARFHHYYNTGEPQCWKVIVTHHACQTVEPAINNHPLFPPNVEAEGYSVLPGCIVTLEICVTTT